MEPLTAEILTERLIGDERAAVRRTLRLGVSTFNSGDVSTALILNMSETGLLIESPVGLTAGETLFVDIPETSASALRVVWTDNMLAGCEFVDPVSTSAVSAAQLKSPLKAAVSTNASTAEVEDSSAEVEQWSPDESVIPTAIVIVTSLIAVLALILLLVAILPPS